MKDVYEKGQLIAAQHIEYDEESFEDLEEKERWIKEEDLLEKLTSAVTLEELKEEIIRLESLVSFVKEVEKKEVEKKLTERNLVLRS